MTGTSWRTTLAGIAAAVLHILAGSFPKYATVFNSLAALAVALLGAAAKDSAAKPPPVVAVPIVPPAKT